MACLKCLFKRACSFPYILISHPVNKALPSLPAPLLLSILDRGTPKSIHNCIEHVNSAILPFPLLKSLFLVATDTSHSNFASLCQSTLASISAFIKKITSPALLFLEF